MSNTDRRLPLAEAKRIADDLVALLGPVCERIEIAGSIRRQKVDIGDVEIVCIPKRYTATLPSVDLFGNIEGLTAQMSELEDRCAALLADGTFRTRPNKDGKVSIGWKLKWMIYQGFPIDLYICERETWGVTLAIRTGSAEFSHKLVTPRNQGGFCPNHLHFKGWRVVHRRDGEALDTPEEADVFRALGIEYIKPTQRFDSAITMRRPAHA